MTDYSTSLLDDSIDEAQEQIAYYLEKEHPIVYYPGMHCEVHVPFRIFNASHVIAVDLCDYWIDKDKQIQFMERFIAVRKELKCMFYSNVDIVKNIIIDESNWYFRIEFTFEETDRVLDYYCHKNMNDTWCSELENGVDVILGIDVRIDWNGDMLDEIKKKWIESNAIVVTTSPFSDDWVVKTDIYYLKPLSYQDLDTIYMLYSSCLGDPDEKCRKVVEHSDTLAEELLQEQEFCIQIHKSR